MALDEERHRRGLHRLAPARSSSPARISRRPNTDAAQRKAMRACAQAWRQGRLRHRLPAQSLGSRRPWRGRGALYRAPTRVTRASADDPARLRPDRRHRGGAAHRRRHRAIRSPRCAHPAIRPDRAPSCCKRGPMGCVVLSRRDPGVAGGRHQGPRLSGRGLQRARRGRRLHVRLPARLAARRAARRPAAPTPMPAAPSPSRGCSARRKARPSTELRLLPRPWQRPTARCAATPAARPYPLGDDAPAADAAS